MLQISQQQDSSSLLSKLSYHQNLIAETILINTKNI